MNPSQDPSFRQLRYFATLAEDLHFGRAASRLGISQPSLSRQIQSLEKIVGVRLVERTQRNAALTAAGVAFAERARLTLEHHEESVETARNVAARQGEQLAIGFEPCAPFHGFANVVRQFLTRFPGARLSSFVMPGPEQAEALRTNRIDLGFVHPPVPDGGDLMFEKVAEERFVVAVPSGHRLALRKRIPACELADEKFVLFPRELAPGCYDAILRICNAAGFVPEVVHESNEISVSLGLIPVMGAVSLFPACVGARSAAGVKFREIEGSLTTVTSGFLRRTGEMTKQVERFLKCWQAGGRSG